MILPLMFFIWGAFVGSTSGSGRSPGERNGYRLQDSCLETLKAIETHHLNFYDKFILFIFLFISTHSNLIDKHAHKSSYFQLAQTVNLIECRIIAFVTCGPVSFTLIPCWKLHPEPWSVVLPFSNSRINDNMCLHLIGKFSIL